MKKLFFLLLVAAMCFSLVACAQTEANNNEVQEQEAQNSEQMGTSDNETQNTEQDDTQQSEAEPQEKTIELTLDNWQEYLEINQYLSVSYLTNAFDEVTSTDLQLFTLLEPKEEYSNYKVDVSVEYNMDYCVSDIIYNLDDFSFELVDCVSHPDETVNESQFVRGNADGIGQMSMVFDIGRCKIIDGKVEKEWITYNDVFADVYRQAMFLAFDFRSDVIEQNEDGTGYIDKCPTNIQITKIEGTLNYAN